MWTPLVILAPIIFCVLSRISDSERRREVEQITGRRMFAGGIGCGIVTLIVAAVMPQLLSAVIIFLFNVQFPYR